MSWKATLPFFVFIVNIDKIIVVIWLLLLWMRAHLSITREQEHSVHEA